jgi:hypothetical protein
MHGGDLKGMPLQLNGTDNKTLAAAEEACAALCVGRNYPGAAPDERCVAWVINVPGCKSGKEATFSSSFPCGPGTFLEYWINMENINAGV